MSNRLNNPVSEALRTHGPALNQLFLLSPDNPTAASLPLALPGHAEYDGREYTHVGVTRLFEPGPSQYGSCPVSPFIGLTLGSPAPSDTSPRIGIDYDDLLLSDGHFRNYRAGTLAFDGWLIPREVQVVAGQFEFDDGPDDAPGDMLLHLTLGIDEEISPTAELAARAIAETARALGNLSSAELTGLFQPFKDVPGW